MQTYKFGWEFSILVTGAMALYTWFTVKTTAWRSARISSANLAVDTDQN